MRFVFLFCFRTHIGTTDKICDKYQALCEDYEVIQGELASLKLQCKNALEENREAREEGDWWKHGEAPPF